ncbi:MAG TPA: hypothetical protein VEI03_15165 [Stellaceae bacterium]|nr:hypothetical protein [Stellaceae bacterium]
MDTLMQRVGGEGGGQEPRARGYVVHHVAGADGLSADVRQWLQSCLVRAMPSLRMSTYFTIKRDWFNEYDDLFFSVEAATGDAVALLASRWRLTAGGNRFLHATTQLIATRWQRTSMLKAMWARLFAAARDGPHGVPDTIVFKTCNPSAFRPMLLFSRVEGFRIYPRIDGRPQESDMKELAGSIAGLLCPGALFSPESGVIKGVSVPPDFYPELPPGVRLGTPERYFHEHLTPADRVLCITRITTEAARSRILQAFGVAGVFGHGDCGDD